MARTVDNPAPASKKPAAPRQKKVLAALSPTVSSPEVMLPVVALDERQAQAEAHSAAPAGDKKKDKDKSRVKKQKLVRDSFTMPEAEYEALADVKKACIRAGVAVKKSELLRVAVALLRKMEVAQIQQALAALAPVKAGRPSKQK